VVVPPDARGGGPSLFWPGILVGIGIGIGIAGTLDEVVLHQLLAWHHFYDRSTPDPPRLALALAGILLGAGGFNLYDGTVQHKLLGLHQVREGVPNNRPYDLAFPAIAGALLLRRTRQPTL
jgi:uncharacterized membrane protein